MLVIVILEDLKLEELKTFCNFEEVYGGVDIKEVYIEEYIDRDKAQKIIYDNLDKYWEESGLDTVKNVAVELYESFKELQRYSVNTVAKFTAEARNINYGNPKYFGGDKSGKLGVCKYILCTRDIDTGKLRFFTKEENEMKKRLLLKNMKTSEEKEVILDDMVKKGELPKEDYYDARQAIMPKGGGYGGFFRDMKSEGIIVTRGTLVKRGTEYILEERVENSFENLRLQF